MIRQEEWMDMQFLKRQGMSISQIARETGHTRKTVRRYLRSGMVPRYPPRPPRPTVLDPFKEVVLQLFTSGVQNGVVLYEKLAALGYQGGYDSLKKFLTPLRAEARQREASVRFETAPGQQSQVDWGHFHITFEKTGRSHWMYLFLLVLGWSRYRVGCFFPCQDLEHFLLGHQRAFEQIGGITETILYDNLTSVVILRHLRLDASRLNPRFLDFATYYGFVLRLCQPARPQTKGKVERPIGFVRQNFFCGRAFWDEPDLHRQFRDWLVQVNARPHGTTREVPAERLVREAPFLIPVDPARCYPLAYAETRRVPKDCLVSWRGCQYSVAAHLVGTVVEIREPVEGHVIQIFHRGALVASHRRLRGTGQWSIDPTHYPKVEPPRHLSAQRPPTGALTPAGPGGSHLIPQVAVRDLAIYNHCLEEERR